MRIVLWLMETTAESVAGDISWGHLLMFFNQVLNSSPGFLLFNIASINGHTRLPKTFFEKKLLLFSGSCSYILLYLICFTSEFSGFQSVCFISGTNILR